MNQIFALAVASFCVAACEETVGKTGVQRTAASDGIAVVEAIKASLAPHGVSEEARFMTGWSDLDSDGSDEAIVYLSDRNFCGSSGCDLFVLVNDREGGWRVDSKLTVSRLPVYRLATTTNGWADLGVTVAGGGLRQTVMRVPRQKDAYTPNPTVPPASPTVPGGAKVILGPDGAAANEGLQ